MGRLAQATVGVLGCALIGVAATAAYLSLTSKPEVRLLAWDDAEVVARGAALYRAHCAGCHGLHGEGQAVPGDAAASVPAAPAHDASGHTWQHPDFALVELTKTGISTLGCRSLDQNGMPKFDRALTDREVVDVLSYIKSTWPPEIRAEQDKANRLYASQNAAVRELLDLPGL